MSLRIAFFIVLFLGAGLPRLEAGLFRDRSSDAAAAGEYLIVSGGPALGKWEDLRNDEPHDLWWGNFIRSARFRMTQLIDQNPDIDITWLVYRPAYLTRGREEPRDRIADILSVPEMFARDHKHPIRLVWFDRTEQLIDHINQRDRRNKIVGFEYFGHSNAPAFMFDYSNRTSGASRAWFHESDLGRLRRRAFHREAFCKSWGCYSGNSFCSAFRKATRVPMWGATGKTDYSVLKDDKLPVVVGRAKWVRPE